MAGCGRRTGGRLCVIGMGKLGGRELGYHSDLDLIFLYPGSGATAGHERYPRLAQRLVSFLQMPLREGPLYQIDTRLRRVGISSRVSGPITPSRYENDRHVEEGAFHIVPSSGKE